MTAKRRVADEAMTCVVCRYPIYEGTSFVRGLTNEPYHRQCRRLRGNLVDASPPPAPPGPILSVLPQATCGECGEQVDGKRITKDGRVYCRPCYKAVHMT